jgi:hypothetical protein
MQRKRAIRPDKKAQKKQNGEEKEEKESIN